MCRQLSRFVKDLNFTYKLLSCYFSPDGIPEQFDGNLNIGSDISDWIRREVTADEIEVNLKNSSCEIGKV